MELRTGKIEATKVKPQQKLATAPDWEPVPGPTGALTLPPCAANELIWMNPEHRRTEEMKKAWKPEVWQAVTVS